MLSIVIFISPHLMLDIFSRHSQSGRGASGHSITHHVLPTVWSQTVSVLDSCAVSYTVIRRGSYAKHSQ